MFVGYLVDFFVLKMFKVLHFEEICVDTDQPDNWKSDE